MIKKDITSIAELEKEQEKLKLMMEVTRQEFARSIGSNRREIKSYLLKNVAVPAGIIGLGVAGTKSLTTSSAAKASSNSSSTLMRTLLPIGLKLLKSYLSKPTDPSGSTE